MREIGEVPEWVVPGTPVVVIKRGGTTTARPLQTTINKVAKRTFTVDGSTSRFSVDRQECREGGTWGWTLRVVPADSPEAQRELLVARKRMLVTRAQNACDEWLRNQSRTNRLAAIAALEAVQNEDVP